MITPYSNIISVTTEKFPFEFTINTANTSTGSTAANQFKLPLVSSLPLNAVVDWGDGSSDTITVFNQAETTHTYASSGTYTVSITGDLSGWQFNNGGDKLKMLNVNSWGILNISVGAGFWGCTNLTCSATDAPLITSTNLDLYFAACPNFNGGIGNWDVSNVTSMIAFMIFSTSFNKNIGAWDVRKVGSFYQFMYGATSFNNDGSASIGNWVINTTSNVSMREMFFSATAFNQDIGNWDVSNVTNFVNFMANKSAANYSAANLDSIYNGWSSRPVQPNLSISFGSINYTEAGQEGKNILTNSPNNWVIVDGSQSPALLLDTYSGAAAAYSLRLLRSDYTGKAIRVRRASDNTEQDIGFVGEDLNTSALTTFCSGTNGFVKTWYDQSGNARDATQVTASNQPQIVSSGSLILENGKVALYFKQSQINFFQLSSNINAQATYSCFAVSFANQSATSADMLISGEAASYGFRYTGSATSPRITITKVSVTDVISPVISANKQLLGTFLTNNINVEVFTDSVSRGTAVANIPTMPLTTIGRAGNGGQEYEGNVQEIIVYLSDQSSNRTGIETNINDFYSIY